MRNILIKIIFFILLFALPPTFAQQSPPYETKLLRLAEIFGALHSLQNLCGTPTNQWYDYMNMLIEAEQPMPQRRAYFYAAFNDAYRAFSENYHHCTQSAIEANQKYMKEGRSLSENLLTHYNNQPVPNDQTFDLNYPIDKK
ncbi:TIGR02301 family protein [Bartonella pachyuromydis]|uniref:TIGR02301 family protein n=1 Tax=Bartonella pachyuromydis TaxID=931097 RepID=A0ABP8VF73_9HYPH